MGGGSGGHSSIDLSRLTNAAEDRLRQLAQEGTHILFACEEIDRKALESHLLRSNIFDKKKYDVIDASKEDSLSEYVDKASIVVVFTSDAKQTAFLDKIVERALQARKQGIHGKAKDESQIPSKATAYRWPSLIWSRLEEMFS